MIIDLRAKREVDEGIQEGHSKDRENSGGENIGRSFTFDVSCYRTE